MNVYIILHKFDIISLSDSTTPTNDDRLQIPWYTFVHIRCDHPSNPKRGGVCIYYRSYLPLKVTNIVSLHKCVSFELQIGDKIRNFVALYGSPRQPQDDFEIFADNLEITLEILVQKILF